ncbi:hypothetical protein NQ314_008524 [Rhamnusium bicolor]|uniref:Peptidase M24 domain-containing protein n=1 Tax=Rhamnusium bicolor TaxID=1586634 RepID=A0AAV8YC16_9CUCU|nr:hypothetical protein NQ314_008524 [Rhamnusium bicolor]
MNISKVCYNVQTRNLFWKKRKPNFGKYKIVEPGKVSPRKLVPHHIPKPSYYNTGEPIENIAYPEIKNYQQIEGMRESCTLAANILKKIEENVKVGQTTEEIDVAVYNMCIDNGAYPSPLNYKKFPKSVCTSVNNVACHGIPDDRPLLDVGNVDDEGRNLVNATEICLNKAISICKSGTYFKEIGACIEETAYKLGFQVVPAFIGHGIGHYFHGPPDIFHIRNDYPGKMESGMTFTIEPVLTQGGEMIEILEDNWTAVTIDFARTAQFEHTVLITDSCADILTLPN